MDKTILTLAGVIIILGGIAAYVTFSGSEEAVETSDDIEIVFADGTSDTVEAEVEVEEITTGSSVEVDEEPVVEEEESSEAEEESAEEEIEEGEETEETESAFQEIPEATPEDDWETTFEFTTEDTEELYRVRVGDEETTNTAGDPAKSGVIEYASSEDGDFNTIESIAISNIGETTFSMDDAGYSFLTLTQNGYEQGQYYLINKNGQNVYPLIPSSTYYYVYGGLGGKIFVVQSRANGDGGLYLNYYNDEKVECAVYNDNPIQGDSVEVEANEVTFTVADDVEESAGESITLDFTEVCEV